MRHGPMNAGIRRRAHLCGLGALPHNKSLQRTFDPPPLFAVAKNGVASNAAELRRCASNEFFAGALGRVAIGVELRFGPADFGRIPVVAELRG